MPLPISKPLKNDILFHKLDAGEILLRQFKNPLLLVFFAATTLSFLLGQKTDAVIILTIMFVSVLLGFLNEFQAEKTVSDLLRQVSLTATVIRHGQKQEIPLRDVQVSDTILLYPGSIVPADLQLTSATDLQINESVITGESLPGFKKELDSVFMGTSVVSGSGIGTVVAIGSGTSLGKISLSVSHIRPESEFQKGLRQFGLLLVKFVVVMSSSVFLINVLLGHSPITSLLFSLAIAVGITPELLPIILTVSLSYGAKQMAKREVIVKQLTAIEDLGNIQVLCTDKTGTLTEGKISLAGYFDSEDSPHPAVLDAALICNTAVVHHRVFGDPIDSAIWEYALKNKHALPKLKKIFESPFDYEHHAMFTVCETKSKFWTYFYKGSPEAILSVCDLAPLKRHRLQMRIKNLSEQGFRVIALAQKPIDLKKKYSFADASRLKFVGLITFTDTPKSSARASLEKLQRLGIQIKILTGDNELVTRHTCSAVNMPCRTVLSGPDLDRLTDLQLTSRLSETDAFVHLSPHHKQRLVQAFKSSGKTVGFMGDGVNDVPALHAADVGICVNSATDVAKDTANVVLLHKSLSVIADGVIEGRHIFNNTVKYLLMVSSFNFGNMLSGATASLFLPFLPMTPSQILLTNSIFDISQLAIPADKVDPENLVAPRSWDLRLIKRFMLFNGPVGSLIDLSFFLIIYFIFHARGSLFQTGWFIESLLTQAIGVLVIRTHRVPFFTSLPGPALLLSSLLAVTVAILLPLSPLAALFSFVPVPYLMILTTILLVILSVVLIEIVKKLFFPNHLIAPAGR
jgi:P-type Mg2+ transporter